MRKILSIAFLSVLFVASVSCKGEKKEEIEVTTTKSAEVLSEDDDQMPVLPACTDLIFIKRSSLPSHWQFQNKTYICDSTSNLYKIDMNAFTNDPNYTSRAAWLKRNGKYIDFTSSYMHIEKAHKIVDPTIIASLPASGYTKLSYNDLKKKINDLGIKYDTVTYSQYVKLQDLTGSVNVGRSAQFDPSAITYSIPLFKSILHMNTSLGTNPDFEFIKTNVVGYETIVFKVGSNSYVYNYSKIPKKKSAYPL